ncbi:MAG: ATP-binding cassette domain-containing protein, partial [Pirellulales bacterium]
MADATPSPQTTAPLLRMNGVEKSFPGVRALSGVDLEVDRGEVLALIGENGAGKSTLIKILSGAQSPDDGTIEIDGQVVNITDPFSAQRAGISVIYQEFNLVPTLSACENIFLGQEPSRISFIPAVKERRLAEGFFERIGVTIDPAALCRDLSVAHQQVVEIVKALAIDARIIVMDEPSATLSSVEVERLMDIVRELKSQGI